MNHPKQNIKVTNSEGGGSIGTVTENSNRQ